MTQHEAGEAVIDAFLRGDARRVVDLLDRDATFHSPVTDYRGREQTDPVLAASSAARGGSCLDTSVRSSPPASLLDRRG